jgi:hypothetical protein
MHKNKAKTFLLLSDKHYGSYMDSILSVNPELGRQKWPSGKDPDP